MNKVCDMPTAMERIKSLEAQVELLANQLTDCIKDRDIAINECAEATKKYKDIKSRILSEVQGIGMAEYKASLQYNAYANGTHLHSAILRQQMEPSAWWTG